ncbi:MAG TPA: DUF4168 domain-containing protein [Halalkalibaculum sp.]|nr:DUF4168 domain-containing protein [Halalkalibaculum sp.]
MNFFKKTVPVVLGILLMAGSAFAQGQQMQQMQNAQADSVSDKELEKFVETAQDLRSIQENIQSEVQGMVQEEDMTFQRFQQIMMSKQNPQMAKKVEVTDEEEAVIKEMQPKLQKIQQEANQKQMSAIQENGLTPQRFQQIAQAVQSDPAMMKRFQQMSADTASGSDG